MCKEGKEKVALMADKYACIYIKRREKVNVYVRVAPPSSAPSPALPTRVRAGTAAAPPPR